MEFVKKILLVWIVLSTQLAWSLTCEEVLQDNPSLPQQTSHLIDSTLSRLLNRPVAYEIFDNALPEMQRRSPESKEIIQIPLGKLTQEEFNKLRDYFPFQSQINWEKNREYDLVDFLSPVMQALSGKYLKERYDSDLPWMNQEDIDLRTTSVSQVSNCFTTTWEILRNLFLPVNQQVFHAFWWNDEMTFDLLTRPDISEAISEQRSNTGDAVIFFGENNKGGDTFRILLHTAIRITDDLYFDKPDTTSEYGWRLVRKKTMYDFISENTKYLVEEEGYQIRSEHRRFHGSNLLTNPATLALVRDGEKATDGLGYPVLMTSETRPGGGITGSYYSLVPFQVRQDQQSRGVFAPHSQIQTLPLRRRN